MKFLLVTLLILVALLSYSECRKRKQSKHHCRPCIAGCAESIDCECIFDCCVCFGDNVKGPAAKVTPVRKGNGNRQMSCMPCMDDSNCPAYTYCMDGCCLPWLPKKANRERSIASANPRKQ